MTKKKSEALELADDLLDDATPASESPEFDEEEIEVAKELYQKLIKSPKGKEILTNLTARKSNGELKIIENNDGWVNRYFLKYDPKNPSKPHPLLGFSVKAGDDEMTIEKILRICANGIMKLKTSQGKIVVARNFREKQDGSEYYIGFRENVTYSDFVA
jgi:hypothetical protein